MPKTLKKRKENIDPWKIFPPLRDALAIVKKAVGKNLTDPEILKSLARLVKQHRAIVENEPERGFVRPASLTRWKESWPEPPDPSQRPEQIPATRYRDRYQKILREIESLERELCAIPNGYLIPTPAGLFLKEQAQRIGHAVSQ
ncbi:hypothetical protein HQ520_08025, partial [bacterium]|nr:hypothetical protein [bacterium]